MSPQPSNIYDIYMYMYTYTSGKIDVLDELSENDGD